MGSGREQAQSPWCWDSVPMGLQRVAQRWASFALLCGSWTIIACMSRLRRLVLSDRWFFITCRLLPRRRILSDSEFATLAEVIDGRRAEHGFVLTAWVFLPDHWHAIFYPRHPLTISRVMEAIKDGATKRINRRRREVGMLWQIASLTAPCARCESTTRRLSTST